MFQFDADNSLADEGVWKEFKGSEFLIAHISNMKFQRALSRGQQPYRKKLENGTLDPKINKEVICKAMAEGVLLDWRKVVDKNKAETPYTVAAGIVALSKDTEFREFISEFSMELMNFRKEELEDVGNG